MADKETKLSIVIRTVDQATAKIKAINEKLEAATKPFRDLREQLSDLRKNSGLDEVVAGFKGVGSAIAGILSKIAIVGGVIGAATAGLISLVNEFDDLGDKAEIIGVGAQFLAEMRYAAEQSGASIEQLDGALQSFSKNLGLARAGSGLMVKFLGKVSPVLLTQLKATKSNEEALDLLAGAMAKIQDPAKRAAFAQKTLGDASLAPLFHQGAKGVKALRDRYAQLNPDAGKAADAAGNVDKAMKDLKASTDGVKAALVVGLAPALEIIVKQLQEWFTAHREDIKAWAVDLGKKLPAAFNALVDAVGGAIDFIRPFVDSTTKLKIIAAALAAVIVGPLISAIVSLGIALLTTPVGWVIAGIAAMAAVATIVITKWDALGRFWDKITGGFAAVSAALKILIAPIVGLPAIIISSWGTIKDFFTSLWEGITSVFSKAWGIISAIVDKVVGAVDRVKEAIGFLGESVNPFELQQRQRAAAAGGVATQARSTLDAFRGGVQSTQQAKVTVDFANAPRGTRVNTDPQSSADVDLSVGYQLNPGGF